MEFSKIQISLIYSSLVTLIIFTGGNFAFAENNHKNQQMTYHNGFHAKKHSVGNKMYHKNTYYKAFVKAHAQVLGVTIEGKDFDELAKEVWKVKIMKSAKELNIVVTGKTINEIASEVRQAKLIEKAKELNIDPAKRTNVELRQQVYSEILKKRAQDLNVDTTNLTTDILAKKVHEAKIAADAKQYGVSTLFKNNRDLEKAILDAKVHKLAKELNISVTNETPERLIEKIGAKDPQKLIDLIQTNKEFMMSSFHRIEHHKVKLQSVGVFVHPH